MLSRVAECLYWAARYLERAEDLTRLLDVNFHRLLDAELQDRGEAWHQTVALLGDDAAYREHFDDYTARNVSDWVLWHDGNPNAVAECVTRARENARSVREQISSEMWESVNRLFLSVRGANRTAASRGPHAFFSQLRTGTHLFQGAADATMMHGDPYEFIQLGLHLERAEKTVRIVAARYPVAAAFPDESSERAGEVAALLRSCGGFEAYVQRYGMHFEPLPVAEELIRSPEFPRSAFYCLSICHGAVERIAGDSGVPRRLLGRLCADLQYGEPVDTSGPAVAVALASLLAGAHAVGDAITKGFFASRSVAAAVMSEQEAQQQQCG
jgi:uncharacterized alpha-E superfamily protein